MLFASSSCSSGASFDRMALNSQSSRIARPAVNAFQAEAVTNKIVCRPLVGSVPHSRALPPVGRKRWHPWIAGARPQPVPVLSLLRSLMFQMGED